MPNRQLIVTVLATATITAIATSILTAARPAQAQSARTVECFSLKTFGPATEALMNQRTATGKKNFVMVGGATMCAW